MIIKEGYNSKPLHIKIYGRDDRMAEVFTEEEGLEAVDRKGHVSERLHYASLEEIIALRDECNVAIKKMAGLE